MKESDLYGPVKQFLERQGYEVKGEVHHCDVVAVRLNETPVVVELKLSLNLSLLLQAVDRLAISPLVYVAVPAENRTLRQQNKRIKKLFRMLGLGLLAVEPESDSSPVQVVLDPGSYKPRESKRRQQRLLGEFEQRVGDPTEGGRSTRKGVITAYRQQALSIARYLKQQGTVKASEIAQALDNPKSRDILYRNVYGWFDRVDRGIYQLSPRGAREITQWSTPEKASGSFSG